MSTPPPISDLSDPPPRGLAVRLFAVVLILVGALDMMLSWRGNMPIEGLYIALFVTGVVLYGVGSVLASRGRAQSGIDELN